MNSALSLQPLTSAHLRAVTDLSSAEFNMLLDTAARTKRDIAPFRSALDGLSVILLFEKASLRTRITFEVGVHRLGGQAIYMDHAANRLGERESIKDYARNLDRWVHAIVARVYSHDTVTGLAKHSSVPVINGLCDMHHPCQALADFLTLKERFGEFDGLKLAYIGDGNNVCHSLMHAAALTGVHMTVITPAGYEPNPAIVNEAKAMARVSGATLTLTADPKAVTGHDAVYTDVWVSMGQEAEKEKRVAIFRPYQVTMQLMKLAGPEAVFMHCLPAKRGYEVTDEVMDSSISVAYDEAENRLHAQNAVLLHLVAARRDALE